MMTKSEYLHAMGIDIWKERGAISTPILLSEDNLTFDQLREQALKCTACDLCKTRKNVVFGTGNPHADIMFIGEAPGANEDTQGEPFVGRAGQLLTNMLLAFHTKREEVYIANILKCRPPNNRDPLPEEVATCTPYLKQQIAMIKPKKIIALGRIAAHFLLGSNDSMNQMRGRWFTYENIPLLITYHPAYLLRSPTEKRKAYQDFLKVFK